MSGSDGCNTLGPARSTVDAGAFSLEETFHHLVGCDDVDVLTGPRVVRDADQLVFLGEQGQEVARYEPATPR